jgi:hypothetical protein
MRSRMPFWPRCGMWSCSYTRASKTPTRTSTPASAPLSSPANSSCCHHFSFHSFRMIFSVSVACCTVVQQQWWRGFESTPRLPLALSTAPTLGMLEPSLFGYAPSSSHLFPLFSRFSHLPPALSPVSLFGKFVVFFHDLSRPTAVESREGE